MHHPHTQFTPFKPFTLRAFLMLAIAGCTPPGGNIGNDNQAPNDNVNTNTNDNASDPSARLQPSDLTYEGAFRLPAAFNWGGLGLAFYPDGSGGAGSLLVTGFELLSDPAHPGESCWDPAWNCYAFYGEVTPPAPARAVNWEDLPEATLAGGALTSFDAGLASAVSREFLFVSGLEYVPRRGSQSADKIYGSINLWYAEGVMGESTFPTVWLANMDGTQARGLFQVGPDEPPYHGRKMGSYLFTVPEWYADAYLGGRRLVTGRSRGTPQDGTEPVTVRGGSQGPTLFAFEPFDSDDPGGTIDALPMLYYRVSFPGCAGPNVGTPEQCDYPDFTMCDDWTGGTFIDDGEHQAIALAGFKGLGVNCYDEPPVVCDDPCSDSHGYHCQPYERQVILYDVREVGEAAQQRRDPWTVLPYATWRPAELYLRDTPCTNLGGMTFDERGDRLYLIERGLGGAETNALVVHVWSL